MSINARSIGNYQVKVSAGKHEFLSDEPVEIGGDDTGPNPFDLLLGSLASCMVITMKMYAKRKGWVVNSIDMTCEINTVVTLSQDGQKDRRSIIDSVVKVTGDLTPEQIARMIEIGSRCPVHRALKGVFDIRVSLS